MRSLWIIPALLLAGCATAPLTPTTVNPTLTQLNNNAMCVVAAANGDCSIPCVATATTGACANLPATATVQDNQAALTACIASGALGKVGNQFAAIKMGFCGVTPPVVTIVPPGMATKP